MDGGPIHGFLKVLVDPVTRLVEENPRVGWKIHGWGRPIVLEEGTGAYWEGWNKYLGALEYL